MQTDTAFFTETFQALTGFNPMAWQTRLYKRMLANNIPEILSLPTGLGKTSVIPIWLIALCRQAQEGEITLPRRMDYVVDRRTVVDQATAIVETIRRKLDEGDAPLLTKGLRLMSPSDDETPSLGISTLRGELADNAEWRADAARPAITIGTIDMTGSKLLFGGYGDGANRRAMHAGLIGIDALLVYDEAHLSPTFSAVLRSIINEQRNENADTITLSRRLRVMEMSATAREDSAQPFRLNPSDEADSIVQSRIHARKSIRLHQTKSKTAAMSLIAKTAASYKDDALKTLIYITLPADAAKIANRLANRGKESANVGLLTGEIRGRERDCLAQSNLMRWFLDSDAKPSQSVYLVCTSAGEVGIDIDADRMICDMPSLDSMIQRLGRVNRRGNSPNASIDVIIAGNERDERAATAELLQRWAQASLDGIIDGSPKNIETLVAALTCKEYKSAIPKKPELRPATGIAFDQLSMTSLSKSAERNLVPEYLRGIESHVPETTIAWRREARHFNKNTETDDIERWFRARPILAADKLTLPTSRAKAALIDIAQRLRKQASDNKQNMSAFATLIHQHNGACEVIRLTERELSQPDNRLEFQTVVLPDNIGGLLLPQGTIEPKAAHLPQDDDAQTLDVGIAPPNCPEEELPRYVYVSTDEEDVENLNSVLPEEFVKGITIPIPDNATDDNDDKASKRLILYQHRDAVAANNPADAKFHQTLAEHHARIKADMENMAKRLALPTKIQSALAIAAKLHDCGKEAAVWQEYAQNANPDGSLKCGEVLAKSENYGHPQTLGGYRHEWGSAENAKVCEEVKNHPERELILHLIGAHHGRCRPSFPQEAYDKERMTDRDANISNAETTRRYAKLQRRFGRWGLAWLEALVKCADAKASTPN